MSKIQAKTNMIKQQIRTWNILDERVLDVLTNLPREDFVPPAYRRLAFADAQIPLNNEQCMMSPNVEARMLQCLNIKPTDKILEIGTGSGYTAAALAKLGQHVYSVDINPNFIAAAEQRLKQLSIENVTLQEGNAAIGWDKQQPYDIICITGSMPIIPTAIRQQLKTGGRLFVIVGKSAAMEAMLITRVDDSTWTEEILFETEITPLSNAIQVDKFQF